VGSRCRARRRRHGPLRVFRHRPTRHRPTLVRQKDLRVRPQHPPKIRRRSTSTGSRFADDPGSLASWSSWCRFGADDAGIFVGSIHSHPGIDRHRELSATDIRAASWNAENGPSAIAGKPFLSVLATAGEAWSEGMPEEDWGDPVLDFHLVFPDRSIVRPHVHVQSEVE
jgi:hypothetical protein